MATSQAYHRAVSVLGSVLSLRGCNGDALSDLGPFEIDTMLNGQTLKFRLHNADASSRCFVHFDTEPRGLSESQLEKIVEQYAELWNPAADTLLVVSVDKPQPKAIEYARQTDPGFLQLFWLNELMSDKTKHVLVPPHEALVGEALHAFTKRFNHTKLPKLLHQRDVAARWFGIRPGQVAKITRSGKRAYYRLCVRMTPVPVAPTAETVAL